MKTIALEYYGMRGEGPTVREAKADAGRKLQAAMTANYTPRIVAWGKTLILVWQTPHGVVSGHVRDGRISGTCWHGTHDDLDEVEEQMRYSAAQLEADVESDEWPGILPKGRRREFASWVGFQRAWRHASEHLDQLKDYERHVWACEHGREFVPEKMAA